MSESEEARKYLKEALRAAGVDLKPASEALGLNHAYLQQYIEYGKPMWLKETVREALVATYGLDAEKLKPPPVALRTAPKRASRDSHDELEVHPPRYGQFVDDPGTLQLLEIWGRITSPTQRRLALRVLTAMASDQPTVSPQG